MSHPPLSDADLDDEDQAALRFAAANEAGLCTIVGIEGSFSRRIGAQLAVGTGGRLIGSLSDGCLERELAAQVDAARGGSGAALLRYGQGSPFIDFRLPCGAGLDVLIEPQPDRAALRRVVADLDARRPARAMLPLAAPGMLRQRDYLPRLRLLVLGAGPESEWLMRLARSYGLECSLFGPDQGLTLGQEPSGLAADAWTAVVLLFHDHEWEPALLRWALSTDAFYIGSQGGAQAREQRLARLAGSGLPVGSAQRIRSPIGLIPHTRDARTLALSVLSDVAGSYEGLRPAMA